ncbi:hypothetical protein D9756_011122 [Leucocoprinus leucothites]|uniref:HTH CENPB-type domain-containing protein n=1 Tax=Leucocoprinus leucothites TaxID=201217 RepID=A0A8H5CQK2_9AGAR|nr:hypothetical protein D9756_011122 [Leucoagaricus leucothites]
MPRKALSLTKKSQIDHELYKEYMMKAVALYNHQLEKEKKDRLGLCKVCSAVEKDFFHTKGIHVHINHNTLCSLVNGEQLKMDSNASRSWLSDAEADEVIKYVVGLAEMGFPLDHRWLKEHVDEIARSRWQSRFPDGGVGKNWTYRFIEKYSDQLHMYKGRALDTQRGQAGNPATHKQYFDLVEEVQLTGDNGAPIAPECTWAMDESGFQANGNEGIGGRNVIGPIGKKVQYQQQAGSCENITVLVTIGADGSALPPAVLYAGKGYLVKWKQDNPANVMLGYSKKGWTDNVIGLEYAKHFEALTRSRANGRTRVLYLDGHASHVTRSFLEHCQNHSIKVICYPPHITHIYQGLDVVVFSPLKAAYGKC